MQASNYKELLKFVASMIIFGTNGLLVNHINLSSAEIVLLRTFFGTLFLLLVVMLTGRFDFAALKVDTLMATLGGAALGTNWMLLFAAYREASVSLATLTYYCGPMLVLALSPLLFGEKLTGSKMMAIAAVAVGMLCISGSIDFSASGLGLLFGAGAALFYAALIIFNKKVKRLSGLHCALYELAVAFVVILIYLLASGVQLPIIPAAGEWPYVLTIGLLNTGVAYYLYFSSLQKLAGQTVALICYIDPLSALLLAAIFLHESLLPIQMLGAVLIMGGAIWGELAGSKQK
ncbi:MAG: DMT family transporter [Firmicutes bacterium]|nr:DMT family transporter [Bacillota bacterium]